VQPYTPLEVLGRDEYVAEGCYNCHSQMVRPIRAETERYGEYSKPGEFIYDHPFQWGSRRIGPDLHRIGGKYPDLWHVRHMQDPASVTPGSIMPVYAWMLSAPADFASIQSRIDALLMLGVPYGNLIDRAEPMAREQARQIAQQIVAQGGPAGLEDKQIIALIAYLQRLGTDLMKPPPQPEVSVPLVAEPSQPAATPPGLVLGSSGTQRTEEVSHAAQ
jgi:cytochrome c oxidase cbb3-type subunit I/II